LWHFFVGFAKNVIAMRIRNKQTSEVTMHNVFYCSHETLTGESLASVFIYTDYVLE